MRFELRNFSIFILGMAALAAASSDSAAQIPPELPMTQRAGVGVRALGMGGAYGALSHDLAGLHYNPAGLAGARRGELSLSFERTRAESDATFLGNTERATFNKTRLQSIGFVYPFPTLQGSLVLAAGYQLTTPFDLEYERYGFGNGVTSEEEFISEQGKAGAYRVGLGWDATPRISVGLTAALLRGDSFRLVDFFYTAENGDNESTVTDNDAEIRGYSGNLGAQFRGEGDFTYGLSIALPERYTLEGRFTDDVIRYEQTPGDTLTDNYTDVFEYKDKVTMPWKFTGSVAYETRSWTLSSDITFVDWTSIDYDGPIKVGREFAYRSTYDVRLGAEFRPDRQPWRIRAGYAYLPLAYNQIGTNVFLGESEEADIVRENQMMTVGAGLQLDRTLWLDGAFTSSGFEREGASAVGQTSEKLDEKKIFVSLTYRAE